MAKKFSGTTTRGTSVEIMGRGAKVAKSSIKAAALRALASNPYFWGAIALVVLVLAVVFLASPALRDAVWNIWVLLAIALGAIYGGLKGKTIQSAITVGLIFGVVIAVFLFFLPTVLQIASPVLSKVPILKEAGTNSLKFLKEPEEYLEKVVPKNFVQPKTEAPAQKTISAKFLNPIKRDPLDVAVQFGVLTSETDLDLELSCMLDGEEISTNPSSLSFDKSVNEQFASIICSNPVNGSELTLKATAPFKSESVLEVFVGEGDVATSGSKMLHESPYSLSINVLGNQPLQEREIPYPVEIQFFRKESLTKVIELSSFELISRSENYNLRCRGPLADKKFSGTREELDQLVIDKNKDGFVFICDLQVLDVPREGFEKSIIEAKAIYTIEKEFKTKLRK